MTLSPLERVATARIFKEEGAREWRASLRAARAAGHSLAEVAEAAGITRQAVHSLTGEPTSPTETTTSSPAPTTPSA